MVRSVSFPGDWTRRQVLQQISDLFSEAGWITDLKTSPLELSVRPDIESFFPFETQNVPSVRFYFPSTDGPWATGQSLVATFKYNDTDTGTTFGTTLIAPGIYTFYIGQSFFYIQPPEDQTLSKRYGTLFSLLVDEGWLIDLSERVALGYFVWADRTPDISYRRTDHGVRLSSPDYIYVSPNGRRYNSLTPKVINYIPLTPFQQHKPDTLTPFSFVTQVGNIVVPFLDTMNLYLYVPALTAGYPSPLTFVPDTLSVLNLQVRLVTYAPPLALPVFGEC